jgi:hypothetical protein
LLCGVPPRLLEALGDDRDGRVRIISSTGRGCVRILECGYAGAGAFNETGTLLVLCMSCTVCRGDEGPADECSD